MKPHQRIIVALDVEDAQSAFSLIKSLTGKVGYFKIGLELLMLERPEKFIHAIHEAGAKVFVDGKFNDIPNTIGRATSVLAAFGVEMLDVHAAAGEASIEAAVAHAGGADVIAVTVLTSLKPEEARGIFGDAPESKVLQFAKSAARAGASGVVCSPLELKTLSEHPETTGLLKVTPGIRPTWASRGDQSRIMTPAEAIRANADYLVIGRPITSAPAEVGSPAVAADMIAQEISEAL